MTAGVAERAGLRIRPPFSTLFAIDPVKRSLILAHMREHGFDPFEGIDAWEESDGILTVVDGHTRLDVATELGVPEVPVNVHVFADQLAALRHALHKQRDRRNLTAAEMMKGVLAVDAEFRRPVGWNRFSGVGGSGDPATLSPHKSAERTAEVTGVSESTVKRVRAFAGEPDLVEAVEAGEMSLLSAATEARERRRVSGLVGMTETGATASQRGHAPGRPYDGQPWFEAKEIGHEVAATVGAACNEVERLLAKARGKGLDLAGLMADRRASPGWNEAIREGRRLVRLVREASEPRAGEATG